MHCVNSAIRAIQVMTTMHRVLTATVWITSKRQRERLCKYCGACNTYCTILYCSCTTTANTL